MASHDAEIRLHLPPPVPLCFFLKTWYLLYLQKEEGKVQVHLNHTDSSQYIRDLKDQISELKHEVRPVKMKHHVQY